MGHQIADYVLRAIRHLSVFPGLVTLQAAAAVADQDAIPAAQR